VPPPPPPPPVPTLKTTFEKHLDAVKWVIGLPVAILFGTTQFVDKIAFVEHPGAGKLLTAIVIVSALTTVLSVAYYFLSIKLADYKILSKDAPLLTEILGSITYYASLALFLAAFVLTVIGLIRYPGVQLEKKETASPVAASPHFTITTSGPVKDRKGTHVHTFLLDQNTGELWRMECSSASGVRFVRVPAQDLPAVAAAK
jgi:uncharacterized membrane protein (DUF485 family)